MDTEIMKKFQSILKKQEDMKFKLKTKVTKCVEEDGVVSPWNLVREW
jgi:hypothetical protein